jgi:AcrR family transcriptional regulator
MAATEHLLVAQGSNVSTRAIAEAAGIAEGTIFRVFPTKEAIIDAIFDDAFSREAGRAALSEVEPSADLRSRMVAVVGVMQRRIRRIQALFAAVGFRRPPFPHDRKKPGQPNLDFSEIAAILEPDRELLRVPPGEAARLLLALVMALTHPMLAGRSDADPESIVDLILNGIARHPASPAPSKGSTC